MTTSRPELLKRATRQTLIWIVGGVLGLSIAAATGAYVGRHFGTPNVVGFGCFPTGLTSFQCNLTGNGHVVPMRCALDPSRHLSCGRIQ